MSQQEILSVVDENDQVIEQKSRSEIHAHGLRHRAVHILLFNHQQAVFLQKRSLSKDSNPGLWDSSAAGHVDAGESYHACALREIEEELGFAASDPLQPLFKLPATARTGMEFCQVFRLLYDGPITLNRDEIDEGRWYDQQAIHHWIDQGGEGLTESFTTIWKRIG